jgi:hypothetical protein
MGEGIPEDRLVAHLESFVLLLLVSWCVIVVVMMVVLVLMVQEKSQEEVSVTNSVALQEACKKVKDMARMLGRVMVRHHSQSSSPSPSPSPSDLTHRRPMSHHQHHNHVDDS